MQGVRARARAREVQKTKTGSTIKDSSEVRFTLLQASNKNIGRFPKNVGHFPKNVGDFSQNVGDKIIFSHSEFWLGTTYTGSPASVW